MNTKLLLTSTSLFLALAGVTALFVPDSILSAQGVTVTTGASLLVQLLGAGYLAFAMMNWAAKDSAIGGIYARPVSLANFSHFFVGTMLLLNHIFSNAGNLSLWAAMFFYAFFTVCFYWLVFRATGTAN